MLMEAVFSGRKIDIAEVLCYSFVLKKEIESIELVEILVF